MVGRRFRTPCTPLRCCSRRVHTELSPSSAHESSSDTEATVLHGLPQPIWTVICSFLDCDSILRLALACRAARDDLISAVRDLHLMLPDDMTKLRQLRCFSNVRTLTTTVTKALGPPPPASLTRHRGRASVNYLSMAMGFAFGAYDLDALKVDFRDEAPKSYGVELAMSVGHCLPSGLLELSISGGLAGQAALDLTQALAAGACPKLRHLALHHNRLGPIAAAELAAGLECGSLSDLITLDLDHCDVMDNGVVEIAKGLSAKRCMRLRTLGLRANKFFTEAAAELFDVLANTRCCPDLRTLNLTSNCIFELGTGGLAEVLRCGAVPMLQHLSLESTFMDDAGAAQVFDAMREGRVSGVQTLSLRGNKIADAGMASLSKLLQDGHLARLEALDLAFNWITDKGLTQVARALWKAPVCALSSLILDDNAFGDEGLVNLVDSIVAREESSSQATLKELCVGGNAVTERGACRLLEALADSTALGALETLGMSACRINAAMASRLAHALDRGAGRRLRVLLLNGNSIGDSGATALCRSFINGACPELRQLHLRNNVMGDPGVMELSNVIKFKACAKLASLFIKGNKMTEASLRVLEVTCADGRSQ